MAQQDVHVSFRLSIEDRDALRAVAGELGLTLSELLRHMCAIVVTGDPDAQAQ